MLSLLKGFYFEHFPLKEIFCSTQNHYGVTQRLIVVGGTCDLLIAFLLHYFEACKIKYLIKKFSFVFHAAFLLMELLLVISSLIQVYQCILCG